MSSKSHIVQQTLAIKLHLCVLLNYHSIYKHCTGCLIVSFYYFLYKYIGSLSFYFFAIRIRVFQSTCHHVLDTCYCEMSLDYALESDVCYSQTAPCIKHSAPLLIAVGTTHRERERKVAVAAEDKNKRRKVVVMAALKTCSAKQTGRVQVTALNDS